ncbi:MAG: deoxyribodipyrimidine photo-lyase, partial [Chlamydiia bacterium]|nr:deoxyribodipyrimidine photo-lyase [Chlamydiia bacterium]
KLMTVFAGNVASDTLDDWGLLPQKPDWAGGLRETWHPGETGAQDRLATFLDETVANYHDDRDRPDIEATSRLSPHLAFGEISPAQCWHAAAAHAEQQPGARKGVEKFLKELGWREFSYHLLFHTPSLPVAPFRQEFAAFPWDGTEDALERWQRGRTGYPIVDAGLRELWHTGWMHNRVRMIVASFLTKHLNIHWHSGAEWFWDTLVDADLANNSASWQWVAGCGADAAPYFRIFNPILQGQKFDPQGTYIRHWVPELADVPLKHLNTPWEVAPPNYPPPLVDHQQARQDALNRFKNDVH